MANTAANLTDKPAHRVFNIVVRTTALLSEIVDRFVNLAVQREYVDSPILPTSKRYWLRHSHSEVVSGPPGRIVGN